MGQLSYTCVSNQLNMKVRTFIGSQQDMEIDTRMRRTPMSPPDIRRVMPLLFWVIEKQKVCKLSLIIKKLYR